MNTDHEWYFVGTYREWRGKSDPSGFGRYEISSTDASWLHERMLRDRSAGHRVGIMKKRVTTRMGE